MTTDTRAAHLDRADDPASVRGASLVPPRHVLALIPLLYLAALGTWVGFDRLVARLINDDASYYVLVARDLFVHGPSYDGLYLTNGVHPLYAALLGAIYGLLPLGFGQLAAVSVIACVALGCAFLFIVLGARPTHASTRIAIVASLSSIAVYPVLYRGMEGALALFVMALYLVAVGRGPRPCWHYALLSMALWAARLELMALPPIVAVCGSRASCLSRIERRRLLAGWGFAVLAFGAYAAASQHWIGIALPVSGLIKQSSGAPLYNFITLGTLCAMAALGMATLPVAEPLARLGSTSFFRPGGSARAHTASRMSPPSAWSTQARSAWMTQSLLAFAGVFYLSHAWGQQDTERQTWYYFPIPALVAFALVELGGVLPARLRHGTAGLATALAVLASVWEGSFVIPLRGEAWMAMRSVAESAKRVAAPGDRFMGPGWMSLLVGPEFEPFSQDGLVGGAAQYRALREGRLLDFAYESGVRFLFIASPVPSSVAAPQLPSPWELSLVSEGAVPNGGSLWAALSGQQSDCGLGRCNSFLAVYRLSPQRPSDGLAAGGDAAPPPAP
jgi:hypothetical protein